MTNLEQVAGHIVDAFTRDLSDRRGGWDEWGDDIQEEARQEWYEIVNKQLQEAEAQEAEDIRRSWEVPSDIDPECVDLCKAMNRFPGIHTFDSCCGHGREPYRIWFDADSLGVLPNLLYWFDGRHCGFYHWRVGVATDCAKNLAHFYVEGPIMGSYGEDVYAQSAGIAKLMMEEVA